MHAGCPGARANGGGGAAVGVPGGGAAVGVPALACEAAGEEKAEIGSSMEEAKDEIAWAWAENLWSFHSLDKNVDLFATLSRKHNVDL